VSATVLPVGEAELGGLHGGGRLIAGGRVGAGEVASGVRDGRFCGDIGGQCGGDGSKLHSKPISLACVNGRIIGADAAGDSFAAKTLDKAPKMSESTRIREAYFTEFAEKVQAMNSKVPIQLSGGMASFSAPFMSSLLTKSHQASAPEPAWLTP
jgi:hypothetical protein